MGCGCKKKSQPVQSPTTVKITEVNTTQQVEISLSDQQQQQVETIVDKLNRLDETTR